MCLLHTYVIIKLIIMVVIIIIIMIIVIDEILVPGQMSLSRAVRVAGDDVRVHSVGVGQPGLKIAVVPQTSLRIAGHHPHPARVTGHAST